MHLSSDLAYNLVSGSGKPRHTAVFRIYNLHCICWNGPLYGESWSSWDEVSRLKIGGPKLSRPFGHGGFFSRWDMSEPLYVTEVTS